MLLDKLLDYVEVQTEPFATCLISPGWRLNLPGPSNVMFHFVMQGRGALRLPDGTTYSMERFHLAVVPHGARHTLECGLDAQSERSIDALPSGEGVGRTAPPGPPAISWVSPVSRVSRLMRNTSLFVSWA